MSGRTKPDPLALRVTLTFYDFLMGTEAGRAAVAGRTEDSNGAPIAAPLLGALRKIQDATPGHGGLRRVGDLSVEELDALAPLAKDLAEERVVAGGTRYRPFARASQTLCQAIAELREIRARLDPHAISAYRFPLHDRLRVRQAEAATVMQFLDWLSGPGTPVVLAERDPSRGGALRACSVPARDLMLAFLDIDPDELAQETYGIEQSHS